MPDEEKTNLRLEIAHVLFMDIVGYSKLLVDEQREALHELNHLVLQTEAVREAEGTGSLMRLPTGDGMALVFTSSMEAPVECALQLSQALRAQPSLPLRMGIHSGPVQHVSDVNGRENIAGAGINVAQRVMDCGDAGHILVSKRVADDLATSRHWQPCLHELGDCEVKHGMVVSLFNLYAEATGNPAPPTKFGAAGTKTGRKSAGRVVGGTQLTRSWRLFGAVVLVAALTLAGFWWLGRKSPGPAALAAASSVVPAAPVTASVLALPIVEKSIAVLPFSNLSDDKANAFFTDGVQDEILTDLAKVADLKVIARSSVMQYKADAPRDLRAIAADLGVAHVLEGSVQRAGNQVHVTAQLIDTRTAAHEWAERYDRDLSDVFKIQSELALAIASQLQVRLSPQEKSAIAASPTTDLAAYDLYLRARDLFERHATVSQGADKEAEAIPLLEQALVRDPKFLQAQCLLARIHGDLYRKSDHTPPRLEQFNAAVQAAARLAPDAGETHHLALANYHYERRDYAQATAELTLVRRTLPNESRAPELTGYMLRRQGQWEEAVSNLEQALTLDPRNFHLLQQLSQSYRLMRRYADTERTIQRALTVKPGDPVTRLLLAEVPLYARADLQAYRSTLVALLAESPSLASELDDPLDALCERSPAAAARALAHLPPGGSVVAGGLVLPRAYWEGVLARYQDDAARARAAFDAARVEVAKIVATRPDSAVAVSYLGLIDAGLGRKEDAINEGRRACELLPVTKDAIVGPYVAANLALIYAWTDEKAAAVEQLTVLERAPNQLPYGQLKLDPEWDSLRGDQGFEALVDSLAPKP